MNYPSIKTLDLYKNKNVTNLDFLTNLEKLGLADCFSVIDLNKLTKLRSLDIQVCGNMPGKSHLNNESFKYCTNLTKLNLTCNEGITTLNHLTKLKILKCGGYMCKIKNDSIKDLDLTELYVYGNRYISDINHMTNLKKLDACDLHTLLPDSGIKQLNLKYLKVVDNLKITNVNHMTNLTFLNAMRNSGINDEGIKDLTQLKTLISTYNDKITPNENIKNSCQDEDLIVNKY
jgi:hypothetical protein